MHCTVLYSTVVAAGAAYARAIDSNPYRRNVRGSSKLRLSRSRTRTNRRRRRTVAEEASTGSSFRAVHGHDWVMIETVHACTASRLQCFFFLTGQKGDSMFCRARNIRSTNHRNFVPSTFLLLGIFLSRPEALLHLCFSQRTAHQTLLHLSSHVAYSLRLSTPVPYDIVRINYGSSCIFSGTSLRQKPSIANTDGELSKTVLFHSD